MLVSLRCLTASVLHVVLSEPTGELIQSPSLSLFTEGGIVGKIEIKLAEDILLCAVA